MRDVRRDEPLVVGMTTHEVDGREVQLSSASRAARDLENARDVAVRELNNLLPFLGGLGAIRGDEALILLMCDRSVNAMRKGEHETAPSRSPASRP